MPPRSFYIDPRTEDFVAYARAFFPDDLEIATKFAGDHQRPYIENEDHIAAYLGVSPKLIRQIIHRPRFHYRRFFVSKADGTKREIFSPKTYLKVLQWWIADNVLVNLDLSDRVFGFRRGRSYLENARQHLDKNHILNLDIEKFFPSISDEMIFNVFIGLGYPPSGATALTLLTSLNGSAPTGAPTSPVIGNLVLRRFDDDAEKISIENNILYTRYADDLTFSSTDRINDDFRNSISDIVHSHGFKINVDKSHFMGHGERMEVTGLVVNSGLNLKRNWRNWARGYLYRALNNPTEYASKYDIVCGIYGTLKAVDPHAEKKVTILAKDALSALSNHID